MTEWQIVYRVYRWIMEHSTYDYDGDTWAGQSIDPENEPEMLPARLASFLAEGPLFYEAGVCFGYAKAGAILLGLEGLEVRRVVAFSYELPQSRTWTKIDPNTGKVIRETVDR